MVRAPKQERAKHTVEMLLLATEQLLRAGEPVSTNRIARRAGVSIGSLYQYFPDKEALIATLATRRREALTARLAAIATTGDIEAAVLGFVDTFSEDPELQVALSRQVLAGNLPAALQAMPALGQLVGMAIRLQGLPVEHPEATGQVLVTSVTGTIHAALMHDPAQLQQPAFRHALVQMVHRTLGIDR